MLSGWQGGCDKWAFMKALVHTLALLSCFFSGAVLAAGMGEAKLLSRFGEPLVIEVQLYHEGALDEVSANIASESDYLSMGLERNRDLRMARVQKVVRSGEKLLVIETKDPYEDLWVTLLLDVRVRNGLVRRRFDLLVDLPETNDSVAQPASSLVGNQDRLPGPATRPAEDRTRSDSAPIPEVAPVEQRSSGEVPAKPIGSASEHRKSIDTLRNEFDAASQVRRRASNSGQGQVFPVAYRAASADAFGARLQRLWASIEEAENRLESAVMDYGQVVSMIAELDQLRSQRQMQLAVLDKRISEKQGTLNLLLHDRMWISGVVIITVLLGGGALGFIAGRTQRG